MVEEEVVVHLELALHHFLPLVLAQFLFLSELVLRDHLPVVSLVQMEEQLHLDFHHQSLQPAEVEEEAIVQLKMVDQLLAGQVEEDLMELVLLADLPELMDMLVAMVIPQEDQHLDLELMRVVEVVVPVVQDIMQALTHPTH